MRAYIIRRLLLTVPTLFIVSFVIFVVIRFMPGDIVDVEISQMQEIGVTQASLDPECPSRSSPTTSTWAACFRPSTSARREPGQGRRPDRPPIWVPLVVLGTADLIRVLRATCSTQSQAHRAETASQWQLMRWRFLQHKAAVFSLVVLTILYLVAILVEFAAPYATDTTSALVISSVAASRDSREYSLVCRAASSSVQFVILPRTIRIWGIPAGSAGPAVIVTAYRPDSELWTENYLRRVE